LSSARAAEAETPFNLQTGPLFRCRLVRLSQGKHVLMLTLHHLICDAVSCDVLVREFAQVYETLLQHQTPALPPVLRYSDYAEWQQKAIDKTAIESELSYWRKQLQDCPVLSLPYDCPRGARPV